MKTSKEYFLESAVLVAADFWGVNISLEKITEIIGDKMEYEWTAFTYKEASPFMDTMPREQIANHIAYHYLGRRWPTYADGANMDDWMSELLAAMKEKG